MTYLTIWLLFGVLASAIMGTYAYREHGFLTLDDIVNCILGSVLGLLFFIVILCIVYEKYKDIAVFGTDHRKK